MLLLHQCTMLRALLLFCLAGAVHLHPDTKPVAERGAAPVVATPLGTMKGTTMRTRLGKTIFAFRGVRYAKPPVGPLRFQPPVPVDRWDGVLDATRDGFACPQLWRDPISEDCLVLNVYSTTLPKGDHNPKRPVIVYFHAGGFYGLSGQSAWAGPQYLMDKELVLVTANYRLGTLGFISTGTKEAPGNNGLKDQVQVLRWVKHNIDAFGGDPDLVTLAGYSAGSASVTLHMVSPMSRGLFHRAIAMSAAAVGNWKLPAHQLHLAQKQARLLACPDNDTQAMMACLRKASANAMGRSRNGFCEFGYDPVLVWSPVVEPDFGQERFIVHDPEELYHAGSHAQVPFMTGITMDEFAYLAYSIVRNATLHHQMNSDFERVAPISFQYERDSNHSKHISRELRKAYFDDRPIDNNTFTDLGHLYADALVGFSVHRVANLVAATNNNPVYYYRFAYKNRYSHMYLPGTNKTVPFGTVHHDDLIYLFYVCKLFPLFKESDPESKIVEQMTTLWANFARTGNPTPEAPQLWARFTPDSKKFLNIDVDLSLQEDLYEKRYEVWDLLFPIKDHLPQHRHNSGVQFAG